MYIGQTGRTVAITEQEHKHHLRLGNTNKSAVAQQGWETGHKILLDDHATTEVLQLAGKMIKGIHGD